MQIKKSWVKKQRTAEKPKLAVLKGKPGILERLKYLADKYAQEREQSYIEQERTPNPYSLVVFDGDEPRAFLYPPGIIAPEGGEEIGGLEDSCIDENNKEDCFDIPILKIKEWLNKSFICLDENESYQERDMIMEVKRISW